MTPTLTEVDDRREELLAEVAILTYDQGLTQREVADRIGVSRSTVSRLLDEARREGDCRGLHQFAFSALDRAADAAVRAVYTARSACHDRGHVGLSGYPAKARYVGCVLSANVA